MCYYYYYYYLYKIVLHEKLLTLTDHDLLFYIYATYKIVWEKYLDFLNIPKQRNNKRNNFSSYNPYESNISSGYGVDYENTNIKMNTYYENEINNNNQLNSNTYSYSYSDSFSPSFSSSPQPSNKVYVYLFI